MSRHDDRRTVESGGASRAAATWVRRCSRAVIAIGVASLSTAGCGAMTPTAPTCEGPDRLQFSDGSVAPLCELELSLSAVAGRPSLVISAKLPAHGPYGAGKQLATFVLTVYRYAESGESRGGGAIYGDQQASWFVGDGAPEWAGTCGVDTRTGGLGIDCGLRSDSGDELNATAELPSAPDPHRDAGLRWLEVSYAFKGDYVAAATVEAAMDVHDDGRLISVPLADGGLLTIMPEGREPDGRTWNLALPMGSPAEPSALEIPEWRPDTEIPSLGACVVTRSDDPFQGSMRCPGEASSATGSATGKVSWRIAR